MKREVVLEVTIRADPDKEKFLPVMRKGWKPGVVGRVTVELRGLPPNGKPTAAHVAFLQQKMNEVLHAFMEVRVIEVEDDE